MNHPDPRKLQRCVIFYIIYFFGRRGSKNLYEMQIDKFDIATDTDGKQYVFQAIDEFDKNHTIDNTEEANQGRMYENPGKKNIKISIISYVKKHCTLVQCLSWSTF